MMIKGQVSCAALCRAVGIQTVTGLKPLYTLSRDFPYNHVYPCSATPPSLFSNILLRAYPNNPLYCGRLQSPMPTLSVKKCSQRGANHFWRAFLACRLGLGLFARPHNDPVIGISSKSALMIQGFRLLLEGISAGVVTRIRITDKHL